MKLLFIEASPRRKASVSTAMGETFVGLLREAVPAEVDRFALWQEELPPFDGPALDAKYARLARDALTAQQEQAWKAIDALVGRLDAADAVVIATPMWNFGIPYRLKHWFDLVTQPGLSFSFDPASGYRPLLRNRPAVAIVASSGDYSNGPSWGRPDLASEYLREALGFIGLKGASIVRVGPTGGGAAARRHGIDAATAELRSIVSVFGAAA